MPLEVLKELNRRLPAVRFWHVYGQTEIAPLATALQPEDALREPGSVGLPTLNVETRVVHDEMGDVAAGQVGEIVHRSQQLLQGYHRDEERTAEAFVGGWFHSGDLATAAASSRCHIETHIARLYNVRQPTAAAAARLGPIAAPTPPNVGASTNQTLDTYNQDQQLTQVSLPTRQSISLGYDASGRLNSIGIPRGTTSFGYDSAGRMSSVTAPADLACPMATMAACSPMKGGLAQWRAALRARTTPTSAPPA